MPTRDTTPASCTRRRILGWSTAGAVGGLACYLGWPEGNTTAPVATAKPSAAPRKNTLEETAQAETPAPSGLPGREDFLPHLKSEFRLDDGTDCTLVEVGAAQKMVAPTAAYTSFSLIFAAPAGVSTESRVHQLSHGKLGTLDLFLSPVGRSQEHEYLEAVFSQRV